MEGAKTVDKLTGQPDCEDPEKAKLVARVEELEKKLAKQMKRKPIKKTNRKAK